MSLFSLPSSVMLMDIIVPYLNILDIAIFEVANTNKLLRFHFQNFSSFSSSSNTFFKPTDKENRFLPLFSEIRLDSFRLEDKVIRITCQHIEWMIKHNIYISSIEITSDYEKFGNTLLIKKYGRNLKSVRLKCNETPMNNNNSNTHAGTDTDTDNNNDASFMKIIYACPNLESFSLSQSNLITDHSFSQMCKCYPLLISLTIKDCLKISDTSLVLVGRYCPILESIELSGVPRVTDKSLLAISHGCKLLKRLIISNRDIPFGMTPNGIIMVIEKCLQLEHLSLESSSCLVNGDLLKSLAIHSIQLQELILDGTNLNDQDLSYLSSYRGCKLRLKKLHLDSVTILHDGDGGGDNNGSGGGDNNGSGGGGGITGKSIASMTSLTQLLLHHSEVSNNAMKCILQSCKHLDMLQLHNCIRLEYPFVKDWCNHHPNIKKLIISNGKDHNSNVIIE